MTAKDFRRIALGMKDAVEGAHMGHPDFRVGGRIFATLHGDNLHGMVKLSPEQQRELIDSHGDTFAPESGAWGRQGCTAVHLEQVDEDTLGEAITLAWQNTARAVKAKAPRSRR
ncbi:MAG: MmcQ/YjbR family DNA-binding protein [Vicinamibacterales bacterium]